MDGTYIDMKFKFMHLRHSVNKKIILTPGFLLLFRDHIFINLIGRSDEDFFYMCFLNS